MAYVAYLRRPRSGRYAVLVALYFLGLLSKAMIITLPLVLLVLDWWPLGRLRIPRQTPGVSGERGDRGKWSLLVREKIPLLALSLVFSVVIFYAQSTGGAVSSLSALSPMGRLANAAVSLATYLRQTVWPAGLAAYYPYPPVDTRFGPWPPQ